jgi:hypothetical protein
VAVSVCFSQCERDAVRTGPAADHDSTDDLTEATVCHGGSFKFVSLELRLAVPWFKAASATAVGCIALPTVASFAQKNHG